MNGRGDPDRGRGRARSAAVVAPISNPSHAGSPDRAKCDERSRAGQRRGAIENAHENTLGTPRDPCAGPIDPSSGAIRLDESSATVEPWKLSFTRGHWYLSGFDRLREDQRLYRVDRIKDGVSLSGPAKAPVGDVNEPIDLRGWELGDGPVIKATILVDADQAAYARHMLGEVVDRPDGSVTATLDVRNIDAFRSFVLSFLEHAEILEPAELRTDFVEWLEAQR